MKTNVYLLGAVLPALLLSSCATTPVAEHRVVAPYEARSYADTYYVYNDPVYGYSPIFGQDVFLDDYGVFRHRGDHREVRRLNERESDLLRQNHTLAENGRRDDRIIRADEQQIRHDDHLVAEHRTESFGHSHFGR